MLSHAFIPTRLWGGYYYFHSHLIYEVQRGCKAIPRSQSMYVEESGFDPSSISFPVCLKGQCCWVHGSCWETEKETRIESDRGGLECYTKEHWWFFISSGKQLTIGSGGGLNALGWFLFESEMLVKHHSMCSSGDAHRGRDLGLEKQILEAFLLWWVLKFWECLGFLRERRLNEDSLTLGEKLTVKAHEAEWKPVKDRRSRDVAEGQACKRVKEGTERTEQMAQWSVCKSNPMVCCWWWWFWLFSKSLL